MEGGRYDRRILDPLVAVHDHTLLYEGVYQDTDSDTAAL